MTNEAWDEANQASVIAGKPQKVAKNAFFIGFGGSNGQNETVLVRDGRAVEGHRSPRRWRVGRWRTNCAKRLGVRQPSGALGGRDAENGNRDGRAPRQCPSWWPCASTGQWQFGVDERGNGRLNLTVVVFVSCNHVCQSG